MTAAEVAKALAKAKAQEFPTAAQFAAFLTSTGQTLADINFRVRVNQIYTKLLAHYTKKVTQASDRGLLTHAHPTQFGTAQTRNLRIVRTNTESAALRGQGRAARPARAGLRSPRSTRSTRPRSANGGVLLGVTKGEEEHALDTAAFARQDEQADRADPRHLRLVRVRGDEDHPGDAPVAGHGDGADPADCSPARSRPPR